MTAFLGDVRDPRGRWSQYGGVLLERTEGPVEPTQGRIGLLGAVASAFYIKASLQDVATALIAMTGEPHPLARPTTHPGHP